MVIDASAGAIAGAIARFLTGPLDVVKIRFQVQLEPIAGAQAQAQREGLRRSKYTGFGQALTTIVREEGIQGLWRGTVPGLLLTVPYTAVQFVALQQVRQTAAAWGLTANPGLSPVVSLASGALAGAAATLASYPFDLLRTTLAAQGEPKVYPNMWAAAKGIVSQRGPAGLYSGMGVTILEIMPYAALQFGLYDALNAACNEARARRARADLEAAERDDAAAEAAEEEAAEAGGSTSGRRKTRGGPKPGARNHDRDLDPEASASGPSGRGANGGSSSRTQRRAAAAEAEAEAAARSAEGVQASRLQAFACGLVAGLVAKLATHPLDVAKKRYQVAGLQRSLRYGARVEAGFALRSLGASLVHIARTEGVAGLWKGSIPSIAKAAPSAAITFAAYDAVLAALLALAKEGQAEGGSGGSGDSGGGGSSGSQGEGAKANAGK
ncbi:hypothetical protein HYH03_004448 [Edaphochlamys debaryana]|uniref:Mitochondrial carrier protein n=1 Tax=Edaphochlamys debaryana TaxID=47281 RepID=A0A836C272_9CHLO|nr:hypothetical protein HYH03_004448 [Edaphochlamys debaryana]|eukprot:KAG2497711.1 hypothetical protein HYH03_004448 [Edaphochlamys debaryana]